MAALVEDADEEEQRAVERPWLTIWRTAPESGIVVKAPTPTTTKPRCETDEYATSLFMSFWA